MYEVVGMSDTKELLKAARKEEPADILLKNARVANLFTMEFEDSDVAVKNGIIVGVGKGYEARETFDCGGKVLVPGFIEGHMHIESTFMLGTKNLPQRDMLGTVTENDLALWLQEISSGNKDLHFAGITSDLAANKDNPLKKARFAEVLYEISKHLSEPKTTE